MALALLIMHSSARAEDEALKASTSAAETKVFRTFLSLYVEDRQLQDLPVLIQSHDAQNEAQHNGQADEIWMAATELHSDLLDWIDPDVLSKLDQRATSGPLGKWPETRWIPLQGLREQGADVSYDEARLELRILIPALLRKRSIISLVHGAAPVASSEGALRPDPFSAFVNVNAADNFTYGQTQGAPEGRQGAQVATDAAINVHNWVLEGAGQVTEPTPANTESPSGRQEVRVVHDYPDQMLRTQAGDVSYPVTGFQKFLPLGGVAAVTEFGLNPYKLVTPTSEHEILLRGHSVIKVWLNGRLIQTLDLPAGKHDLRDFPFSTGVNRVRLEITDDMGRTETVDLPFAFSDLMLARGLHQVAYAFGLPSITTPGSIVYNSSSPTVSVSHRYGLTDHFTFGGYTQDNRQQAMAGAGLLASTKIGTFGLDAAFTHLSAAPASYAGSDNTSLTGQGVRLSWQYTDAVSSDAAQRSFSLGLESESRRFADPGNIAPDYASGMILSASYGQRIFRSVTLNVSARQEFDRVTETDAGGPGAYAYAVSLGRNWKSGVDTSLTFTRSKDSTGVEDTYASFYFIWSFPEKRQYLSATGSTQDDSTRMEWGYSSPHTVGGINTAVGVDRNDSTTGADARIDYTGNRGKVGATETVTFLREDPSVSGSHSLQNTQLRASSALVFSGGKLGITRPVTDSFALVSGEGKFADQRILLNPEGAITEGDNAETDQYALAKTGALGPAGIPEIVSYREYQLRLTAPDANAGLALPQENFRLLPTYKSGFSIRVASDSGVFIRGELVDASGKILALHSGEARSLSEPDRKPEVFFSNREGHFSLESVKPGRYQLDFYDLEGAHATFEVPESASGLFELGKVSVTAH